MTHPIRAALAFAGLLIPLAPLSAAPPTDAETFFETKVRPVLAEHCYGCHGPKKQSAGLRLDTAEGVKTGSDYGPAVVPGQPDKSTLVVAVRRSGEYPMPPKKALPADAVAALSEWVKHGAVFPAGLVKSADDDAQHWAFQPVRMPPLPPERPGGRNEIDRFVQANLDAKGLTLSPEADRRTLIRRVTFDLIGLPPTAAEIDAFAADESPDAYEKLVDHLLASPHYGERWARHWMDVARYADTKGYVFQEDRNYPFAYTYRDYLIRAFNADKPFDRFVVEQLAADRLDLGDDKQPLAALGFLTLGRRFLNNTHDVIDDRIDVVSRGLMGLTVSCARCHDHKYDPIPTADYYSLYGVFASTVEPKELPLIADPKETAGYAKFRAEVDRREKDLADAKAARLAVLTTAVRGLTGGPATLDPAKDRVFNRADRNKFRGLQKKLDGFIAKSPAAPPRAMAVEDADKPFAPRVFRRGNPGTRGDMIPRQFLQVIAGPDRKPFPHDTSGRLELANAIADPANPLTARVMANRVWAWHFGTGLVSTPSDFGTRSDPPTHPALLDWLADRFVRDGWSVKALHRRIVLSATYRQSSVPSEKAIARDPANELLSRQNRRRLEFEPLRDSMLAVAGRLDDTVGGRSADLFKTPFATRRAVYGFIDRQNLPGTFRAFDLAGPDTHAPLRYQTTVPQQALFLMNNPFVVEQAKAVTQREDVAWAASPAEKVDNLYRAILGRSPTAEERSLALAFATGDTAKPKGGQLNAWGLLAQVLLLSNEFAFVD